jgi:acyl transferase domain-containing protein/acyl carrier protein
MQNAECKLRNAGGGRASDRREPIAIIGLACRFPGGASSPERFWQLLEQGTDAISEAPADRWSARSFVDPDPSSPGRMYARFGGFLSGIDHFDARFFGLAPREAAYMDPQQRLLLEVGWEALEDAGLVAETLAGSATGVFIGISTHDYGNIQFKDVYSLDFYANTGGALSIAANRLSYLFNFRGPSVAVDTACSSSLVSVHLACRSLWDGESDLALAGGVNCILSPETTLSFAKGSMLSPDGRCMAFDARANGYVRGEGAGLVVLKPLVRAQHDGDPIYAVILASAINQDGRTHGMTVPSREAQEALLRDVYRQVNVPLDRVLYLEAHGTGTPVGDPIEAGAIGAALGHGRQSSLRIGSVKTNIGHLEAASGIAGLIKVALTLQRRTIPASLHFRTPNTAIAFDNLRLRVQQALEPFPAESTCAVAGVNSFGFGGTNAHVVLREPPRPAPALHDHRAHTREHMVPLSARTPEALVAAAREYAEFLTDTGRGRSARLDDIAYSASVRRSHFEHRAAFVATSHDTLAQALRAFVAARETAVAPVPRAGKLAFVFSGMGPQWWGMGRDLLDQEPVFRRAVEQCDALFRATAGWSILDAMLADAMTSRMSEAEVAQPANFVLQIGLADLWASWGIVPDAVIGHSAGEVAAAAVAGALTLEDAVHVIFHRSRLQQRATCLGRMLAVGLPPPEAQAALTEHAALVSIAAINSPRSVTLSGQADALEAIARTLESREVFNRFLDVNVPYHSHYMDPLEIELCESLSGISPRTARVPLYSTVLGALVDGREIAPSYWWENIREPVRFAPALERMIGDDHDAFVELAPHPVLAHAIREGLGARAASALVLPSVRRDRERGTLLESLGALYTAGRDVAWQALAAHDATFVRLPSYPWQRERHWHESEASAQHRLADPVHPLLQRRVESPDLTWEANVAVNLPSYLSGHSIHGSVVYPAAAYIEMALAAARELGSDRPVLEHLQFRRALAVSKGTVQQLRLTVDAQQASFSVHSRPRESAQPWTLHVAGHLRLAREAPASRPVRLDSIQRRCPIELTGEHCYKALRARGLEYGGVFLGLQTLWQGKDEALGRIQCAAAAGQDFGDYLLHPAMLDACFHVLMGTMALDGTATAGTYLPVQIGRFRLRARPSTPIVWSHARLTARSTTSLAGDLLILGEDGAIVAEITAFKCQHVPDARAADDHTRYLYAIQWYPKALCLRDTPRDAVFLPSPLELARSLPRPGDWSAQFNRGRHYSHSEPLIEALCGAYVLAALVELGWKPQKGERITVPGMAARLGIAPHYHGFLDRLLEILCEDGLLRRAGHAWTVARSCRVKDTEQEWKRVSEVCPEFDTELALLAGCGPRLGSMLAGRQQPLALIFPDGSMTLVQRLYQESAYNRMYNVIIERVVSAVVEALPSGRTLRVLEIGAGTGGTTAHVLPVLPARRTEYVFSDVSHAFTAAAKRQFRDYPFVEYALLDVAGDLEAQGYMPHSFDLVLAADVLHATRDLRHSLRQIRSLLASGGLLVFLELMRPSRAFDLIFGPLEDLWRFEDVDVRGERPWLSRGGWDALLREIGFSDVVSLSDARDGGETFQAVFVARSPLGEGESQAVEAQALPDASVRAREGVGEPPLPSARPAARQGERSDPALEQRWLILADDNGVGERLASWLRARGADPVLATPGAGYRPRAPHLMELRPDDPDDIANLVEWAGPHLHAIVHLWSLDTSSPDEPSPSALDRTQRRGCISTLHLVQALARAGLEKAPRLWLVTRGAQEITAGEGVASVAQAPLWGLGRVVANEQPHLHCTLLDLDAGAPAAVMDEALRQEVWAGDAEQEVALRGHARFVVQLEGPLRSPSTGPPKAMRRSREIPCQLEAARPGVLDSLALRETRRRKPAPGEIEIEVAASGLNFRDVMKAMGLYPSDDGQDLWLGDECAGTVARVGDGVTDLRPGDEVIAVGPGMLRSFVTIPAGQVARKPAHLTFEEAATIPIVFLTSHYALTHLTRLARGERILIHAAAGGVGLSAVQIAQHAGAEIFATAGSPEKRQYLESLGIRYVMDSRSQAFVDEVRRITHGQGVAVVLNSLAGEFIPNSLSLLEPAGRFIELGKIDIYQDHKLGMAHFKNGLSFFAVDLGWLLRYRAELAHELLTEVVALFEARTLRALPVTTFPIADAAGAFRHMAQARHMGKIAMSWGNRVDAPVVRARTTTPLCSKKATYLVSGGLSGLGLAVAQWLVQQGARHLVLVGRRGVASAEAEEAIRRMSAAGVRVHVAQTDVSQADQVHALVEEIRGTMPPLRGIFHAAMVLDDGFVLQLTEPRFTRVMAPKVAGTWNLHAATLGAPLDYFVMFSSISSVTGAPGQGNYCAANAFLDAFAHYRRGRGLPALTINWGAIADVGYVSRHAEVARYLDRMGLQGMAHADALATLEGLLHGDRVHVLAVRADFQKLAAFSTAAQWSRRLAHLLERQALEDATSGAAGSRGPGAVLDRIRSAAPAHRPELLQPVLRTALANVLKIPEDRIDPDQPFGNLGLDSLMAVELEALVEAELGVKLSLGFLAGGDITLRRLSERLLDQLMAAHAA